MAILTLDPAAPNGSAASAAATWIPFGVPTPLDDVIIGNGNQMNWDLGYEIQSFTLSGTASVLLLTKLDALVVDIDGINGGFVDQASSINIRFVTQMRSVNNGLLNSWNIETDTAALASFDVDQSINQLLANKNGGDISVVNLLTITDRIGLSGDTWAFKLGAFSHVINQIQSSGSIAGNILFESFAGALFPVDITMTVVGADETYTTFTGINIIGPTLIADATCVDGGGNTNIQFGVAPLTNPFIDVDLNEFEQKMFERAFNSTDLTDLVPEAKIRSQLPQDTALPYIRGLDTSDVPWGTKCKTGFETTWAWHIWSSYAGNKEVNEISMVLIKLYDNDELDLTEGKNVLLQFSGRQTFIEPDGVTHHAVVNFRALSS